jgi:hypothetical protein
LTFILPRKQRYGQDYQKGKEKEHFSREFQVPINECSAKNERAFGRLLF